jgi:hypothetical protein
MDVWQVSLSGHLTEDELTSALRPCPELAEHVVIDCTQMSGYDLAARHAFVAWNRRHPSIARVAIVTTNRVWHMVVGAMALASQKKMRCFDTLRDAQGWLGEP